MRKTLAFIAVLVGLFASAYLTWAYTSSSNPMVCLGNGCDTVRESQYAHLWGLPLPIYGLAFYIWLALMMLAEARLPEYSRRIWRLLLIISGGGLAFSAWLTYLEGAVIHAWCEWCVTQAIAIAVAFLMTLWIVLKPGEEAVAAAAVEVGEGQEVPTLATRTWGTNALRTRLAVLLVAVVIGAPVLLLLINREKSLKKVVAPPAEQIVGSPTLVRPGSHEIGPADAPLTIVEFGDFQCPSCGVAEKTNEQIRDQYAKKVRFVFRQFPLEDIHQFAYQSAKASECAAEQGKFWPMAEMLYSHQSDLTAPALKNYAKEQGLDQAKFDACLEGQDPVVSARIKQDKADGLALGVRGTPTFFLNGKIVVGPLTFLDVEAALSEAKKKQNAQQQAPASEKPASANPETKAAAPVAKPASTAAGTTKEQPKTTPATQASAANPMGISLEARNRLNALAAQQSQSSAFVPCGVNDAPVQDPPMIHVADMKKVYEDKSATIVDVRGASAFKGGHIPTAMNATIDQLQKKIPPELSKAKQIVLYEAGGADESCATSRTAGRILMQNGYKEVKVFKEGLEGWKKQGLPVAQ